MSTRPTGRPPGRPRHYDDVCRHAVKVSLPEAYWRRIDAEAQDHDLPAATVVRRCLEHYWAMTGSRDEVVTSLQDRLDGSQRRTSDLEAVAVAGARREEALAKRVRELEAKLRQMGYRAAVRRKAKAPVARRIEEPLFSAEQVAQAERTPCTLGCGDMLDAYAVATGDARCPRCRQRAADSVSTGGATPSV